MFWVLLDKSANSSPGEESRCSWSSSWPCPSRLRLGTLLIKKSTISDALTIVDKEPVVKNTLKECFVESWTETVDRKIRNMLSHVADGERRCANAQWVRALPWRARSAKTPSVPSTPAAAASYSYGFSWDVIPPFGVRTSDQYKEVKEGGKMCQVMEPSSPIFVVPWFLDCWRICSMKSSIRAEPPNQRQFVFSRRLGVQRRTCLSMLA